MKNQYFGDNRDLFKFDLVCKIIETDRIKHFTYIPMLTANSTSTDDRKHYEGEQRNRDKAKAGAENKPLIYLLNECNDKGKRDIRRLEDFFGKSIEIYRKDSDEYFTHQKREEYFQYILDKLLPQSLVLVDPDIGLEIKRSREKHILYCELKKLYKELEQSVIMIFQSLPRKKRELYFFETRRKLKEELRLDYLPPYITDSQIAFFIFTENNILKRTVGVVVRGYAEFYQLGFDDFDTICKGK